jgi:RNA polymerase primary sigma factor
MTEKRQKLINDDLMDAYFDEIRKLPLLSFEEELALSKRIQAGDAKARETLIRANLRLVIKIARYYVSPGLALMDLIQEGNLGLMRAAQKYDHSRNVRFSTYAAWWIKQSIHRYLMSKHRSIRLPHRKEELLRKVKQVYHGLSQSLLHSPSFAEIAHEIGVSPGEVEEVVHISNSFISLEMDRGEADASTMMEYYEDYTYSPEENFLKQADKERALRILGRLKDKERRVLMYRFQIGCNDRGTLKRIGDKMDISPETVRQIEIRALKKIKARAAAM